MGPCVVSRCVRNRTIGSARSVCDRCTQQVQHRPDESSRRRPARLPTRSSCPHATPEERSGNRDPALALTGFHRSWIWLPSRIRVVRPSSRSGRAGGVVRDSHLLFSSRVAARPGLVRRVDQHKQTSGWCSHLEGVSSTSRSSVDVAHVLRAPGSAPGKPSTPANVPLPGRLVIEGLLNLCDRPAEQVPDPLLTSRPEAEPRGDV